MILMEPMPYFPGAVRRWLSEQPEFKEALRGGRVTTRDLPDPLVKPHVTVQTVDNGGQDPMHRRMLLQVTPWVPGRDVTGFDEDPDVTAWRLAVTAGELLGRARNQIIDDATAWSASWIEGPVQLYDNERGPDRTIFYAPIRVAVVLRHRSRIVNN